MPKLKKIYEEVLRLRLAALEQALGIIDDNRKRIAAARLLFNAGRGDDALPNGETDDK